MLVRPHPPFPGLFRRSLSVKTVLSSRGRLLLRLSLLTSAVASQRETLGVIPRKCCRPSGEQTRWTSQTASSSEGKLEEPTTVQVCVLFFLFAWRGSNTDVSSVALLYSVEISEVT